MNSQPLNPQRGLQVSIPCRSLTDSLDNKSARTHQCVIGLAIRGHVQLQEWISRRNGCIQCTQGVLC